MKRIMSLVLAVALLFAAVPGRSGIVKAAGGDAGGGTPEIIVAFDNSRNNPDINGITVADPRIALTGNANGYGGVIGSVKLSAAAPAAKAGYYPKLPGAGWYKAYLHKKLLATGSVTSVVYHVYRDDYIYTGSGGINWGRDSSAVSETDSGGSVWYPIGEYYFSGDGTDSVILGTSTDKQAYFDAVKFVKSPDGTVILDDSQPENGLGRVELASEGTAALFEQANGLGGRHMGINVRNIASDAVMNYYPKLASGEYEVFANKPRVSSGNAVMQARITHRFGTGNPPFDIKQGGLDQVDMQWVSLGRYSFTGQYGTDRVSLIAKQDSSGNLNGRFDAVKFVPVAVEDDGDEEENRPVYMNLYVAADGDDNGSGSAQQPFRTVSRAKEEAARFTGQMNGDIVINVASGTYPVSQTEVFSSGHSGKNGYYVVLRGDAANKPVFTGGVKVEGWEQVDNYIYKAQLPNVADVRNLYINGYPAQRAKSKYGYSVSQLYSQEGSAFSTDGFVVSKKNFPNNLTQVNRLELSWTNEWVNQRTPVDEIIDNGDSYIFKMRQPAWNLAATKPYATVRAGIGLFYIENARELLDQPGEFYFDQTARTLYYYPLQSENLQTAESYVGKTEGLLSIQGESLANKAENIIIENIDFRHGEFFFVSQYGFVSGQVGNMIDLTGDPVATTNFEMPGQISINQANRIQIRNCVIKNQGSSGIVMENGASNISLTGNYISDLMGGGISVGSSKHGKNMAAGQERPKNIKIKNNTIHRIAQGYFGMAGICAYYVDTCIIRNNDLADLPYTGISFGWGWGADVPECRNFTISNNKVANTMYLLHDGAPIYSLGPIRGTKIYENYFVASPRSHAGIYLDEGSKYMEVYRNVVENVNKFIYLNNNGGNNYIHDNYSTTNVVEDKTSATVIENNTFVLDGSWNADAQSIIDRAGTEEAYRHENETPASRGLITLPKNVFTSATTMLLWAADYRQGGQNVAYYDTTPGNSGGVYRNDDVDIWSSSTISGKYDVGVSSGEWLTYDAQVKEDGEYKLAIWASNSRSVPAEKPLFSIYWNDIPLIQDHPVEYTGSTYGHTFVEGLLLEKGAGILRIEGQVNFFGLSYLSFELDNGSYLADDYDEGVIEAPGQ